MVQTARSPTVAHQAEARPILLPSIAIGAILTIDNGAFLDFGLVKTADRIVDAHQHFWKLGNLYYPWLMDDPPLISNPDTIRDYLPKDYFEDALDFTIVKSVHIEALPHKKQRLAETAWLQDLASDPDNRGFPHGIVAAADLTAEDFADTIEGHSQFPNFRGVRQILNSWAEPDQLMENVNWRENFKRLGDMRLVFDLHIDPSQMDSAARLAADFPGVRIALNHVGCPDLTKEAAMAEWAKGMSLLASIDNVSVKISGFGMLDHGCSAESIRPIVLRTIDMFGVRRCMFGSNFPVCRPYISFHDLWTAYLQITGQFTTEERARLLHDNAINFYSL